MVVHGEGAAVDRLVDLLAELPSRTPQQIGHSASSKTSMVYLGWLPGLLTVTTPSADRSPPIGWSPVTLAPGPRSVCLFSTNPKMMIAQDHRDRDRRR